MVAILSYNDVGVSSFSGETNTVMEEVRTNIAKAASERKIE